MGGKNWFKILGVFQKSRVQKIRGKNILLQCLTEANPREMCHGSKNWKVKKIEGSKHWDSTV